MLVQIQQHKKCLRTLAESLAELWVLAQAHKPQSQKQNSILQPKPMTELWVKQVRQKQEQRLVKSGRQRLDTAKVLEQFKTLVLHTNAPLVKAKSLASWINCGELPKLVKILSWHNV